MTQILAKKNRLFLVIMLLLIVPQSRQWIQIQWHKGVSYIRQVAVIDAHNRKEINYTDWHLMAEDGAMLNFKTTKGKVVFINFWATWCPPCIAEMPSLERLYHQYQKDVVFLFITTDALSHIQDFKIKNNYEFEVYRMVNKSPEVLATKSIPRTIIINKQSEIVVDKTGALNWDSLAVKAQLDQLLKD